MKGSETIDGGALARRLGWFSLGLGMAHLIAGRQVGRAMGIEARSGLLRAYGLREIATGVGILSRGAPAPWIWGRLAGDAMDIATLVPALARGNPGRG
ncbi:MAG: cyclase dehydrase, partial [Alphaproteobacteria bacterium]|nr:cyclase dehydrase [Alphaproteobacteria bacterium]